MLDDKTREQIALFRYGLIADLVHREPAEKGLYPLLREKAERVYEIAGSRRTRVAAETIRHRGDRATRIRSRITKERAS